MGKLDNISKKNIFEVPEGYFDALPAKIQAKVATPQREQGFRLGLALRYSLPVLLLAGAGVFWWFRPSTADYLAPETALGSVSGDQLSIYLTDSELSTEELVETMVWSDDDLEDLEAQVLSSFSVPTEDLEDVLDEF